MKLSIVIRSGVFIVAAAWCSPIPHVRAQADPPEQVRLTVTVTNRTANPAAELDQKDVTVFEDRVEQNVISVSRLRDAPIAFTLMLDSSNSVRDGFAEVQGIAVDCAKRLRPQDAAQVVSFNTSSRKVQGFTNDVAALERAITKIRPDGSTALYAALYRALEEIRAVQIDAPDGPRHVIIVISDGDDTSSLMTPGHVRDMAGRTEAIVYAIRPYLRIIGRDQVELQRIVESTGGRWFVYGNARDRASVCEELIADLSAQHTIVYSPGNHRRDGKWRRVEARISVPDAKIRTRAGYFAPKKSGNDK